MTPRWIGAGLACLLAACTPQDRSPPDEPPATERADSSAQPAEAPAGPARLSRYTRLDRCEVTEARPDEAGYASSTCPGEGRFALRLVDSDSRQNLFVRSPDGTETSLALSEVAGSGFSRLGDRIEWRGSGEGAGYRPDALIVRYFVVESEGGKEVSYLLPARLAGGAPCVAARIEPGPAQNERARAVADEPMDCLRR